MLRAFTNFDSFIFPKIVVVIYWIGIVLILIGTIFGFFGALFMGNSPAMPAGMGAIGPLGAILTLIGGVAGIVIWRITVELWMVLFSIHGVLKEIRDKP